MNNDTEKMAKIWNILNEWNWPEELGVKPIGWDEIPNYSKDKTTIDKYSIITPIAHLIKDIIGSKECLRWHHIHNLNSTNEQFENWWINEYNPEFD